MRNNSGGNSAYGSQVVDAIFSKEYSDKKRLIYNKNVYVDWRASAKNLEHISLLLKKNPKNKELEEIEKGLKKSFQEKKYFYRQKEEFLNYKETDLLPKWPKLKVFIITDLVNVSAALDFIDEIKMMSKNVVLIGKTTKSDRLYMEVRSISLPSNSGFFNFPIKVYRNRFRKDNQPYFPDIKVKDIYDTKFLEKIILEKMKN